MESQIQIATFAIVTHNLIPYAAKLFYLNFHPLEVVSRYRDPQLQVDTIHSYLFIRRPNIFKS